MGPWPGGGSCLILAYQKLLPGPLGFSVVDGGSVFPSVRVYGWEERCKFSEKPQCSAVMIWHLYSRAKSKHIGRLALTVALQTP